jgi:hypothetical protein
MQALPGHPFDVFQAQPGQAAYLHAGEAPPGLPLPDRMRRHGEHSGSFLDRHKLGHAVRLGRCAESEVS